MTEMCHITPTAYLDEFATGRSHHLTLAHLVEEDDDYTNWYANDPTSTCNILDNSAFEMFKQGRPMYPSDKLIEMGTRIGAQYIVMSDYPDESSQKTVNAAIDLAPTFRDAGFGTFFVPQSQAGQLDDLIDGFRWAADADEVDYIGVSILAAPNAYGVESGNNLQRFLSRWKLMQELDQIGIIDQIKRNGKKIHFLGMVDGPNEIILVKDYLWAIDTWDSSAAVWAGFNNIMFDNSPTGLINGKNAVEVDFGKDDSTDLNINIAQVNVAYIDLLLRENAV